MEINKKAFSLLEVLISLTLLSLITISIIRGTRNSHEIKEKVTSEDRDKLNIYMALNMIEWDFSQVYSPLYFSDKFDVQTLSIKVEDREDPIFALNEKLQRILNEKYYNNPLFFAPSKDWIPIPRFKDNKESIEFFTTSHRRVIENSKESVFNWIVYALEDPTDQDIKFHEEKHAQSEDPPEQLSNFVRYSVAKNPYTDDDIDFDKIRPQVIMENVKSLEFSFWNDKKAKFTDLRSIGDGKGRIDAMKIKVVYSNLYGQEEEIERIFRPLWPLYNLREKDDFK